MPEFASLEGKSALVTGGSRGIGAAVARALEEAGATVVVGYRSGADEAEAIAAEIGGRAVQADVSNVDDAKRLVDEAGDLDVLVNNAGITVAKPALELTGEDFDAIFSVDVKGAFLLSVAAAKEMRRHGSGGAIVNVTSVHEHVPRAGFALYAAAKAALGMLTRELALELAPDIRVNAVAPGAIATERNEEAVELDAEIPLGRPGTPAEVAALISYLAGDQAAYVSGASVLVDGGMAQQVVGRPAG